MSKMLIAMVVGLFLNLTSNAWAANNCVPRPTIAMATVQSVKNFCATKFLTQAACDADDRCVWKGGSDAPAVGQCCNPAGNIVPTMVPCPSNQNPHQCCNPAGNPVQPMVASVSQCSKTVGGGK